VLHTAVVSAAEGRLVAQAEYDRLAQERVTGSGTVVGFPPIRLGELVRLDDVGPFDKYYYVTGVTHRLDQSGYTTRFNVRLAAGEAVA
jgi:phage protein D